MSTKKKIISIHFEELDSIKDLCVEERLLLEKANIARDTAYAPYSNFSVGAALLLENGEIFLGSNQENAAYPSGLCAERVAIFYAGASYPGIVVKTLIVTCSSKKTEINKPLSPCGACRQAIAEYEIRQKKPIRIIMTGQKGPLLICEGIENLLPLLFNGEFLK